MPSRRAGPDLVSFPSWPVVVVPPGGPTLVQSSGLNRDVDAGAPAPPAIGLFSGPSAGRVLEVRARGPFLV